MECELQLDGINVTLILKHIKSDIPIATLKWNVNVLAGISDFICFNIKAVFISSSYNV